MISWKCIMIFGEKYILKGIEFMRAIFYVYVVINRLRLKKIRTVGADKYYSKVRSYANGRVFPSNEISKILYDKIKSGNPFFAGRFGANELNIMGVLDFRREQKYESAMENLCNGAGVFPNTKDTAIRFVEVMKDSMSELDQLAIWNLQLEDYYIKKYIKKSIPMSRLRYLEPWFADEPWTKALEGKKVLVVHPFVNTISQQYKKREKLFENKNILPEFDLITFRAVQTIAGNKDSRFNSWFDALDYMYEEIIKIDFDIALLGCGAYGFPLAARLKRAGKQAIHMGGVLQILFGIKGARWDKEFVGEKLYNEYWTNVQPEEIPKNHTSVESGCYW